MSSHCTLETIFWIQHDISPYNLAFSPQVGCTIRHVLGSVNVSPPWSCMQVNKGEEICSRGPQDMKIYDILLTTEMRRTDISPLLILDAPWRTKGKDHNLAVLPLDVVLTTPQCSTRSPASMFKPAAGKFCLSRAWPHPPIPIQGNCFHFIPGVQRAASNRPKNWFFFIIISQPLKFHKNNHRGKCLIKNSNTKGWSLNYNHCHYKHALYYMLLLQLFRFLSRLVNGALKIST